MAAIADRVACGLGIGPLKGPGLMFRVKHLSARRFLGLRLEGDRPKSWAVDWLQDKGVPAETAIGTAKALGGRVTVFEAVGALSAWRLEHGLTKRSAVGLLVTGARRRWSRRVSDDELREATLYRESWAGRPYAV
jgi:hypothetical protein